MYIPHFKIHSSVDRHLSCFHLLAIVNNAVNMGVYICVWELAFDSFEYSRSGIAGSHGDSIFNFLGKHLTVFHNDLTILHID